MSGGQDYIERAWRLIPHSIMNATVWATARCSLRCDYCYVYKLYENQPNKDFDADLIPDLIDFLMRHNVRGEVDVWWFGGEPSLVFEDVIMRTADEAVRRGLIPGRTFRHGMTSNLTVMKDEWVEWIRRTQFGVLVSLDGTEDTHDRHRKFPDGSGSFKVVWQNLQKLRRVRPNPEIRWTVAPDTVVGLAERIKWFLSQGLTNLAIDFVYEVEWTDADYEALRSEFMSVRELIRTLALSGQAVPHIKFVRDGIVRLTGGLSYESRCGLGQGGIGVDINGDIYLCHRAVSSRDPKLKIGNIKSGLDWRKRILINAEWVRRGRPFSEREGRCETCQLFGKYCIGGCLIVNYDMFGDLGVVPDTFCTIANMAVDVFEPLGRELMGNRQFAATYGLSRA